MTETEDAAFRVWEGMFNWAMPAGFALDFVQETTGGNRERALAAIIQEAWTHLYTVPADDVLLPPGGEFVLESTAVTSKIIRGHLLHRNIDRAAEERKRLANRLCFEEPRHPETCGAWLEWCATCERVIKLCRDLVDAAKLPEKPQ